MCVMSMVTDYYEPFIPEITPFTPYVPTVTHPVGWPVVLPDYAATLRELNSLIHEFKRLLASAKEIDDKTGQPDCVDPDKAKLIGRVAELEALLANPPEVVIVNGGKLEPGKYRILDGKMYRLVE